MKSDNPRCQGPTLLDRASPQAWGGRTGESLARRKPPGKGVPGIQPSSGHLPALCLPKEEAACWDYGLGTPPLLPVSTALPLLLSPPGIGWAHPLYLTPLVP